MREVGINFLIIGVMVALSASCHGVWEATEPEVLRDGSDWLVPVVLSVIAAGLLISGAILWRSRAD